MIRNEASPNDDMMRDAYASHDAHSRSRMHEAKRSWRVKRRISRRSRHHVRSTHHVPVWERFIEKDADRITISVFFCQRTLILIRLHPLTKMGTFFELGGAN